MLKHLIQKWLPRQTGDFSSPAERLAYLDDLEEQLILADVGIDLAIRLVDLLRENTPLQTPTAILDALRQACHTILQRGIPVASQGHPHIVLMVGVNGAGKTTAIGKLAYQARQAGQTVCIGAGDTFRAAAQEQLAIWSDRAGATVYTGQSKDAAAVLFDTITQATDADLILLDTAGRLHNQRNLMDELGKIRQVVGKAVPAGACLDVWLVLDATTGQNALLQATQFHQAVGLTGIVLSKWDGSAKGGIVLALMDQLGLPIVKVGVGEGLNDLTSFSPDAYLDKLLSA